MAKKPRAKKKTLPDSLRSVKAANAAVKEHLFASVDLPAFLASAGDLTLNDRRVLVDQALLMLDQNFVHLPLKQAMHGVDPIQKLKLVRHRLAKATPQDMGSEFVFHREMIEIFTSLRDLHTNYMLPEPFAGRVAFLPFDVERYIDDDGAARYLASHFHCLF